jgi:hypothetical protein
MESKPEVKETRCIIKCYCFKNEKQHRYKIRDVTLSCPFKLTVTWIPCFLQASKILSFFQPGCISICQAIKWSEVIYVFQVHWTTDQVWWFTTWHTAGVIFADCSSRFSLVTV